MRVATGDQGMTGCTRMGYRKKFTGSSAAHSSSFGTTRDLKPFPVPSASWTASGSRWYYDATHNVGTTEHLVQVYDQDGREILQQVGLDEIARGTATTRIYLTYRPTHATILIY
jgi:hypothetical protein